MDNKVELIGCYGGDESHALSAWTSTNRDLTEDKKSRIDKLLKMLAENGHHTPFEKSYIHFLVTCDTASHIHLIKHRVGVSINAESARYKELKEDKYLVPEDWPWRS
jgi:thymidylate synthase ThyX